MRVAHKFLYANCNVSNIGETIRHFSKRVREHLSSNKSSHARVQTPCFRGMSEFMFLGVYNGRRRQN